MCADRVTTAGRKARASVKEAIGKLTGDAATESAGAADSAAADQAAADQAAADHRMEKKPDAPAER